MIVDPHSLQVPFICLIWKSAPSILWSIGGAANNQLLHIRKDNLALMARVSLMSLFANSKRSRLANGSAQSSASATAGFNSGSRLQVTAIAVGEVSPSSQSCASASERQASSMRL
jgi:hypothetical protein